MQQPARVKKDRLRVFNYLNVDHCQETIDDICRGMTRPQKCIPSKYFYDQHGSQLFEEICCTPEYYVTRTELSVLEQAAAEIVDFFAADPGDLIELGSGSNRKIKKLLDAAGSGVVPTIRYVPVDISESALIEASQELLERYQGLEVIGIVADFTRHLEVLPVGRKLITFFGSTIGNFSKKERIAFLNRVAGIMSPDDRFVVGIDMLKPAPIIEAAYNDSKGVTRKFNQNILRNINGSLQADFNTDDFEHHAVFVPEKERVEMHLRAKRKVTVNISKLGLCVDFEPGETIHTEICQKFSRESAATAFNEAGLSATRWFTDSQEWFSLVELKRRNNC
jgi:L-histidine N-alpha-methyltransferase